MKLSKLMLSSIFLLFTGYLTQAQCVKDQTNLATDQKDKTPVVYTSNWSYQHNDDIVDIALSDQRFSTLVAAVKAAELVKTLKGDGPFTVFAPTNAAFNSLPDGVLEELLKPENKKQLQGVLTYHVVAGKISAADIIDAIKRNGGGFMTETVQGQALFGSIDNGKVILTDTQGRKSVVTDTDLEASNGLVHVIDSVILPKF